MIWQLLGLLSGCFIIVGWLSHLRTAIIVAYISRHVQTKKIIGTSIHSGHHLIWDVLCDVQPFVGILNTLEWMRFKMLLCMLWKVRIIAQQNHLSFSMLLDLQNICPSQWILRESYCFSSPFYLWGTFFLQINIMRKLVNFNVDQFIHIFTLFKIDKLFFLINIYS